MPTSYMKLPYEDKVLRPDCLRELKLAGGMVGFTLDLGLNYYRGLPLSALEVLELTVDGARIPQDLILLELGGKIFSPSQAQYAISEFWSLKKFLRLYVYNGGLSKGSHDVEVRIDLRNVSMYFGPNGWGMVDGSAHRQLELQEAK